MATTYQAAFGNPHAHKAVVDSLNSLKPDTSNDAALAAALEEEEHTVSDSRHDGDRPASPSGVKVDIAPWEGNRSSPFLQDQDSGRQGQEQRRPGTGASQQSGTRAVSDSELARHLQRVELAAVQDATGVPSSLIFPDLMSVPSSRERTLSRTLSRAPSQQVSPHVLPAPLLLPPEPPVVSADRRRLAATLALYDLVELQVAGDGNCQFRALSDQLYGHPDSHTEVRQAVVATLRRRAESYRAYVPGEYEDYCTNMAKSGTWGDHVTLQAAADTYGTRIVVVTSFADSPVINIEPAVQNLQRTLFLSFWAEVHYNSLYPMEEPPAQQPPRNPHPRSAASRQQQPAGPPPAAPPPHPPKGSSPAPPFSSSAASQASSDSGSGSGSGGPPKAPKVFGSRILGRVVGRVGPRGR
ncbi:hypothetical protein Agub_g11619 [Astrephomene gubernaculifera]|uniref:OTU domain-containing protein n=1 Tax=Astrephomene gubernaculifera TaxID=47775 RepID=A0AAD3DZ96_9CHLO|nr:hypothetical protein Agub_g11619 [Astrephomene gubernaculifera]